MQGKSENSQQDRGKACDLDFDGDGVSDDEDVCPESPSILRTDFGNLETMDLCETNKVKSKIVKKQETHSS